MARVICNCRDLFQFISHIYDREDDRSHTFSTYSRVIFEYVCVALARMVGEIPHRQHYHIFVHYGDARITVMSHYIQ